MKKADIGVAIYILAAFIMLIIPIACLQYRSGFYGYVWLYVCKGSIGLIFFPDYFAVYNDFQDSTECFFDQADTDNRRPRQCSSHFR